MNWHHVAEWSLAWLIAYTVYWLTTRIITPYMKYFVVNRTSTSNTCAECNKRNKYAAYTFLATRFLGRLPFVGQYFIGFLASFWFAQILKTGEQQWVQMKNRNVQSATPKS